MGEGERRSDGVIWKTNFIYVFLLFTFFPE